MSSQPDVDRWRQRLALPPALCYTHIHLASIFSQDNYLATSACLPTHTFTLTHTLLANYGHTKGMITVAVEPHTTCHGVYIHTPQPLWLHKIWQPARFLKGTAPSCSFRAQQTGRRSDSPYTFGRDFFVSPCLNPAPEVMSNSHSPFLFC